MGFAADPVSAGVFYASGHPPSGGNLGVIRSEDGGRTWTQLAKGVNGPVDFHAMDISKADPSVIYGTHGGLQVSRDGGKFWVVQGPLPSQTFDLAASAVDVDTVYAATRGGLMRSLDAGKTWQPAHLVTSPASMVHTTADGTAYAFIVGIGLIETKEPALAWKRLSNDFGRHVLLHLAVAPDDPNRLYGVADTGGVVTSGDGGRSWIGYEGSDKASAERIERGAALYREHCQSCHGVDGTGEPPENIAGTDLAPAPALDDSAHAWHHSDGNLVQAILEGFEKQGGRMPGWKETLSREQAEDVVTYLKSLWSFRSYACQGARHMACMRH
jgi:mono/diheme cytochrome c family protein